MPHRRARPARVARLAAVVRWCSEALTAYGTVAPVLLPATEAERALTRYASRGIADLERFLGAAP